MKDEEQRNVRIREDLNWSCCFCHITDASDLLKQEEKWGVKEQMCRIRLFPSSIHVRYLPTERSCDLPVYSHSAAAFLLLAGTKWTIPAGVLEGSSQKWADCHTVVLWREQTADCWGQRGGGSLLADLLTPEASLASVFSGMSLIVSRYEEGRQGAAWP